MGDSAMVIMWPSRDAEDGEYSSVTLSQRKAPYETMPLPDPDPPFLAELDVSATSVRPFFFSPLFARPWVPMYVLSFRALTVICLFCQVTGENPQMAFTCPVSGLFLFYFILFFLGGREYVWVAPKI
jgi:hypothetical protein